MPARVVATFTLEHTRSVTQSAFLGLFRPLVEAFTNAQAQGEIGPAEPNMLAGAFLALLDALSIGMTMSHAPERVTMAAELINLFLSGARAGATQVGAA